jgi:hypothetical protein
VSTSRYRFGDVTHRGLLGAIRFGQVLVAAAGTGWAIAMIDLSPSGGGVVAALLGLAAAAAATTIPVGGLTLEQWVPVAIPWLLIRATGRARSLSSAEPGTVVELPVAESRTRARVIRPAEPKPPPQLTGVRIIEIPYRTGAIGAISERGGRRLTVLLVARAPGFALADEDEQQQRLAVWGDVLKGACRGGVRRIQWIERTAPAQGDGLARWLHEQRDPDVPLRGSAIGESYLELMSSGAQAAREHEVLLAVQIDATLLRKDDRGQRDRALIASAERVAQDLERARVEVDRALTAGGVARAIRVAFDPYIHPQLAALRAGGGGDELSERSAWPAGARERWGHYQSDGAVHATYEIGGWPRAEVGPAFLSPLLGTSEQVRSVAVCFEPLDPMRSMRQAEHDVTRDETDRQTRRRFGQVETSRQRHASDAARAREAELASGHAEVRLAGFVTATGRDLDELEAASEELVTHAGRANLELRRLYGQQAHAFTFTLPLCRGLK